MSSKKKNDANKVWSLEMSRRYGRNLLVVCPKCGRIGRLYFSRRIGWYVKHGSRVSHSVPRDVSLEIPLHSIRLNLIKYMGGDTFLLPYLSKMIPPHIVYVEVFGGGAPLLLNKPPSRLEIYNDIDGDLVNLFRVVRDDVESFLRQARWLLYSREMYYEFLENLHKERDPVRRAVMYFAVLRMSVNGVFGVGFSTGKSPSNNPRKLFNVIEKLDLIHRRLRNVIVESLDFRELIRKYDGEHTFFYLDPPHLYYATEKSKKYYSESFSESDYMDLLNILMSIKGKWLIKQNYVPYIVEWAEKNRYSYLILSLTKSSSKVLGSKREKMKIVFVANYRLIEW